MQFFITVFLCWLLHTCHNIIFSGLHACTWVHLHKHVCVHTSTRTHARKEKGCVCVCVIHFSVVCDSTMLGKRIMNFNGRMLKQATPHHSAQHNITKWYSIRSSTFPVIQTMPVLQDGCKTETSIRTGYMIRKCFPVTVTLTESVFPEPV